MNILLTCVGRRDYIVDYFREAVAPFGGKVYGANSHADAPGLIAADQSFCVPSLYDPSYVDVLIQLCQQYDIQAVIPLFDLELPILAQAAKRMAAAGIRPVVSSPEVVDTCNDKWRTVEFLEMNGIATPTTFIDLGSALEAVKKGEIFFPAIVKPRWGMGSIGLLEADDEDELRVLYAKVLRVIEKSYLATESHGKPEEAILIQEKLAGQEYGMDVVNDLDGNHLTTFVKKKIAMRSGETDAAITVDEPSIRALGEQIGRQLRHIGNLDVDVFLTDKGCYVLEMNPRLGGGYPFSHLAGANLPRAIVAWLRGEVPEASCFDFMYGVKGFKGICPLKMTSDPLDYSASSDEIRAAASCMAEHE